MTLDITTKLPDGDARPFPLGPYRGAKGNDARLKRLDDAMIDGLAGLRGGLALDGQVNSGALGFLPVRIFTATANLTHGTLITISDGTNTDVIEVLDTGTSTVVSDDSYIAVALDVSTGRTLDRVVEAITQEADAAHATITMADEETPAIGRCSLLAYATKTPVTGVTFFYAPTWELGVDPFDGITAAGWAWLEANFTPAGWTFAEDDANAAWDAASWTGPWAKQLTRRFSATVIELAAADIAGGTVVGLAGDAGGTEEVYPLVLRKLATDQYEVAHDVEVLVERSGAVRQLTWDAKSRSFTLRPTAAAAVVQNSAVEGITQQVTVPADYIKAGVRLHAHAFGEQTGYTGTPDFLGNIRETNVAGEQLAATGLRTPAGAGELYSLDAEISVLSADADGSNALIIYDGGRGKYSTDDVYPGFAVAPAAKDYSSGMVLISSILWSAADPANIAVGKDFYVDVTVPAVPLAAGDKILLIGLKP